VFGAIVAVVGIGALNGSLLWEWVKRWRAEPTALPGVGVLPWLGRLPRIAVWGSGAALLVIWVLLLRSGFRASGPLEPAEAESIPQPNPPPGYEVPAGAPPGNDERTYRAGVSVPAGYALTVTATLWSNQVAIKPAGPNPAAFLMAPAAQRTHGHVTWRLLGNAALADGAPLELSIGIDENPDNQGKTFHVISPQPIAVDWVGDPIQLWPPQNGHTKFLLVKGNSTVTSAEAPSPVEQQPTAQPVPVSPATDAGDGQPVTEWAVGIEARLDPIPPRWLQQLQRPRVGLGSNWVSSFEKRLSLEPDPAELESQPTTP